MMSIRKGDGGMLKGKIISAVIFCLVLFYAVAIHAAPVAQPNSQAVATAAPVQPMQPVQPVQRYTDYGNGTMADTLTGLIWTKDANSPGPAACNPGTVKTWRGALDYTDCLNTNFYLGFTDWRMPDIYELESMVYASQPNTATWLTSQGFSNVQPNFYWTSTASSLSLNASAINMHFGFVYTFNKTGNNFYAWPLRGGKK
jgi:hypothetical protein